MDLVTNVLGFPKFEPSRKICFICLSERPLKMAKNTFYFILKPLFVLKIFYVGLEFLVMWRKRLD